MTDATSVPVSDAPATVALEPAESEPTAALAMTGLDADGRPWRRVLLEKPIDRHGVKHRAIVVRKPYGNDCTGANLTALNNADVAALAVVLPRVTEPVLNRHEVLAMPIDDLAELAGAVIHFLLPRAVKAELGLTE